MFGAKMPRAADCPAFTASLCGHLCHGGVGTDALNFLAAVTIAVVTYDALYVYEHVLDCLINYVLRQTIRSQGFADNPAFRQAAFGQ